MTRTDSHTASLTRTPRSAPHRTAASSRRTMCVGLALLAYLAAVAPASAQNIQYSQGSVGSSLNNTLQIPLRVYPGRGGTSLPVTLYYSSDLWRIKYKGTIYNPYDVSQSEPMADAKYAEYSAAGWTSSLGVPVLEWPEANQVYTYEGKSVCLDCHNPVFSPGNYWKVPRLTVRMPDGSTHELRRDDTPYTGSVNNTGSYYAVDGSRMRYDTATFTLSLSDGSRYILGAATVQFIDRNGNTLNYTRSNKQWTDTLSRIISSPPMPGTPGLYNYNLPGVDGTTTIYKLRWTYLSNVLEPDPETGVVPVLHYAGGHYVTGTPSITNLPQPLASPQLFNTTENPTNQMSDYVLASQNLFNPVVLKEVIFPNGMMYKFGYNQFGEITKVTYPTGGFEQYKYGQVRTVTSLSAPYDQASRGVISRWVSATGEEADRVQWQYGVTYDSATSTYKKWTLHPDDTYSESYLFKAPPTSLYSNLSYPKFGFEDPRNGRVYEERFYQSQGGTLLRRRLIESTYSSRNVTVTFNGQTTTAPAMRNPRVTREVSVLLDTGGYALATATIYQHDTSHQFDTGLDLTLTGQYDFVEVEPTAAQSGPINANGALLHTAETTYLDDPAYRDRNILGLPETATLKDAAGVVVARSETVYDEMSYAVTMGGTAPGWADPQTTARGNATTSRRYVSINPAVYLESHVSYDQWGNPRSAWDMRGNESEVDYSATYKYAYATATTSADPDGGGAATPLTTTTLYDFNTGLATSTTDANGQSTQLKYTDDLDVVDSLNRLRKVIRPDGGWTSYFYNDVVGDLYVQTTTSLDATRTTESFQYMDALGRPSRSFASEGGSPVTYLTGDTQYDTMGRTWRISNPYRTMATSDPVNPTNKWTTTAYDALSRVKMVTLPDATKVQTVYQGIYTTVTDQAGKSRRQMTDALGQVARVDEPNAAGSLGTVDAPTQPTSYEYDTLGNVVHVTQGAGTSIQHRYFKYDALSRLTYERQVEPLAAPFSAADSVTGNGVWTRKLVYDETLNGVSYKGLLTSHYDARNVRTRCTYDNLNRTTQVTYTDGTPTVTSLYDQAQTGYFNKGRLTAVQTAAVAAAGQVPAIPATSQAYDYDLMGRVVSHQQIVGTQSYALSYGYGLGGQLESETYPSGRVVSYGYDDAARLESVESGASVYANNFVYGTTGALSSLTLGNGTSETFTYNTRLQLTAHKLLKGSATIQRYDYKYGQINVDTGALDATKNNGQVASIEGYIGAAKQWQQRFGYDSIGRLTAAAEYRGDNSQRSYLINYDYDLFGNRYQYASENPTSSNPLGYVAVEVTHFSKTTNRYTSGVTYDNAGNITTDNKFTLRQYTYDANNRQKTVIRTDGSGGLYASVYDGAGQRVATINNGATSYLVYDAFGKLVAEYGQPPAGAGGTQYVFTDRQGSTRVVTNDGGTIISRHDYEPFGQELSAGTGMRTTAQFYDSADSVRQKYAGMEADEGSGMSHTLWRQFDSVSGRWTSPDPYGGSMTVGDPQSFNRYSYVNNDPVNKVDPLGLMLSDIGVVQTDDAYLARSLENGSTRDLLESARSNWILDGVMAGNIPLIDTSEPQSGPATATLYSTDQDSKDGASAFKNRANDLDNGGPILSFSSGQDILDHLGYLSSKFGYFDIINIIGHAFPPGMLGDSPGAPYNNNNGLFIEDPGNPAFKQKYAFHGGETRPPKFSDYVNEKNRSGGMKTANEFAQYVGKNLIKIAPNGRINFIGCNTDSLASHVSHVLALNRRSDITVAGVPGSCYLGSGPVRAQFNIYRSGTRVAVGGLN